MNENRGSAQSATWSVQRLLVVVTACAVLATGCVTTRSKIAPMDMVNNCSIPTCGDCTITVPASLAAAAQGNLGTYSCPAATAAFMNLDNYTSTVSVPIPSTSGGKYLKKPIYLPYKPTNDQLCLISYVPPTGVIQCGPGTYFKVQ